MAVPPPSDPREPAEDETRIVPPEERTVVSDDWGPESEVFVEQTEVEEAPPPRRMPQLWPWLLALLVLVLAGLAAAYFLAQDDDEPAATTATVAQVEVPVLVGLRQARAEELAREAGLEPEIERAASAKPAGVVFEQDPGAGDEAERGDAVLLRVSSGPPKETVPDVVGQPVGEAVEDLRAAGLGSKQVEAFGDAEEGTVLKQEPAGGEKLREGAVVTLTVSKGPQPVEVPDVVGTTSSEATAALRDAGLDVNIVPVPSEEPAGTVVAQNPAAGAQAPKGSAVRLNVAQEGGGSTTAPTTTAAQAGPASVPDVVGQELADAARAFGKEGLKISITYVPSEEQFGTVVAQAQEPGTELERGDTVQINVSPGPEERSQARVPDVTGQDVDDARSTLEAAGFEVLLVRLGGEAEGDVAGQAPPGGANVPAGSLVVLYTG
jgi:beta-lactam-binding protein with PASTA domain